MLSNERPEKRFEQLSFGPGWVPEPVAAWDSNFGGKFFYIFVPVGPIDPPGCWKKLSGFLFRSTHLVVSRSWLKGRGPNSPPSLRKSALKFCQLRQKLKSLAKQTKRAWPSTSFGCSGTLREGSRAVPVVTDGPFPKFLCCKIKFWFWGNTGIILEQIPVFSNVEYRYFL